MELQPFEALIRAGVDGVMVGHLRIPALDTACIATLSHKIMHDLLREELHFQGLICTDALEMKGICNLYPAGELEVQVLLAGADLLLLPPDPVAALEKIKEAVDSGLLAESLIDAHCLQVLRMKEKYVRPFAQPVQTAHLVKDLNSVAAPAVSRRLTENSITLLKNRHQLVPVPENTGSILHLRIDPSGQNLIDTFFRQRYAAQCLRMTPKQASDTHLLHSLLRESLHLGLSESLLHVLLREALHLRLRKTLLHSLLRIALHLRLSKTLLHTLLRIALHLGLSKTLLHSQLREALHLGLGKTLLHALLREALHLSSCGLSHG